MMKRIFICLAVLLLSLIGISSKVQAQTKQTPILNHIALYVFDLLDKYQIDRINMKGDSKSPTVRPDGVSQIYFQDPDGYWLEVNDAKL